TCQWVASEIVSTRKIETRAKVIEAFIQIAKECLAQNNFSTLMEINLGLQNPSVERLRRTWSRVSQSDRRTFASLQAMLTPFGNFKTLRAAMADIADRCGHEPWALARPTAPSSSHHHNVVGAVPFTGLYLGDLVLLSHLSVYMGGSGGGGEDADTMSSAGDADATCRNSGLRKGGKERVVNFMRMRTYAAVLRRFRAFQGPALGYTFEPDATCFHLATFLRTLERRVLEQKSLELEPTSMGSAMAGAGAAVGGMRDVMPPRRHPSTGLPGPTVPRATQAVNKESSNAGGIRSQRERELARDIKLALRSDNWSTSTKLGELLMDWNLVSSRDILIGCGISFAKKERALCERILGFVAERGPLKKQEYPFASALVHLASCQYYLSKTDECTQNLRRAITYIDLHIRSNEEALAALPPATALPQTKSLHHVRQPPAPVPLGPEWVDLKDWASTFLAVILFRKGQHGETLRLLDTTSNYHEVLDNDRFAFFALVRAKALWKMGQTDAAIMSLERRQRDLSTISIEDLKRLTLSVDSLASSASLNNLNAASGAGGGAGGGSGSGGGSGGGSSAQYATAVHACHDLHLLLLMSRVDRGDPRAGPSAKRYEEARELFRMFRRDGAKRGAGVVEFANRTSVENVGKTLIEAWSADADEIMRKL
ncbi:hypothetical protein HK101_002327, partial [Irineochytrium annulatum]